MVKCLNKIKTLVMNFFDEEESIGLKSIEKFKISKEVSTVKKENDFNFSDIMK